MKEEWRKIPNFSMYEVSNMGNIRNKHKKILRPRIKRAGYLDYKLINDFGKVQHIQEHQAVGLAFLPNPYRLKEINHKNGFKFDNRRKNLEWCLSKYNQIYKPKNGGKQIELQCQ